MITRWLDLPQYTLHVPSDREIEIDTLLKNTIEDKNAQK